MAKEYKEYSDKVKKNLKEIIDHFETEDRAVRERQIRLWKKMDYYWNGFQRIWWSEVAHDWRVFDSQYGEQDPSGLADMAYYDKPVNVFRAYLEAIIAALSATVPPIRCSPDDADNVNDVLTAKGGTNIAELIFKHNDAPLLWVHALWVYCTQGMIAAYNYSETNEKYGTVGVPKYETNEEEAPYQVCPICQQRLVDQQAVANEIDEFQPDENDLLLQEFLKQDKGFCQQCQQQIDPEVRTEKIVITRLVGETQEPKARQCIQVYGGLFVKVPNYARCQNDIPYLALCYETHYSNVLKKYPHLREKNDVVREGNTTSGSASGNDIYERWGRLSPQYHGEYPINTPTVRNWWLRPSAFEVISDEHDRKELYRLFPNGCKVVFVNDTFAEACNEDLDDHWTLTYNPLSQYIHFDPLGMLLTSIQEITNDLISLTLQTAEHGVSQTFVDPEVLNFDQYRQSESLVGGIFPVKPRSGKSISESFFETRTATLSQEIQPFGESIQSLGQFVSGAVPSIYGGEQSSGSKTAAEYSMSRAQSLQRLQTHWKILQYWWKGIFGKCIPQFIKTMLDDEKWSKEVNGSFINVVVKKMEMDGKIGSVELDVSEQLPFTWAQRKDLIMNLLQSANPEITQALTSPENSHLLAEAIGLDDFEIPGEDDRQKQYEEIGLLIQSGPIPGPNGSETSSIEPDLWVDNHTVEMDICRRWLVGEAGRQCKVDNPDGYKNVLLHMQAHFQMKMQIQQMQQPQEVPNSTGGNAGSPKKPAKKEPEQGATNVPGAQIH